MAQLAKPYTPEKSETFCHPYPKGRPVSQSKFCGVMRIDEPGLYWVWADLGWSDTYPDAVVFVHIKLSPKGEH